MAGEIGVDGARGAGTVRIAVIVEHHDAARCQAGINKGAAIQNGVFDIDVDMGESERQALNMRARGFRKNALMDEALRMAVSDKIELSCAVVLRSLR